ncbi:MAG TPA: DNA polymerase II [Methylomirabilota bacterium]|nr:DNA polymerase II [Methylomirabilota bacterium]
MEPMAERGFILTPTYRLASGRPEVHLHAVLESGEPAVIIDDRPAPYFFVHAGDADTVRRLAPEACVEPTDLATFAGQPVARVEVGVPSDVPPLRARLAGAGVECLEADLRFAYRYLIDRGLRGAFSVEGPFEPRPGVGRVYRNPTVAPADFTPRLRVLAFDVETSLDGQRLYSIAVAGAGGERVFLVGRGPVSGPAEVVAAPDERAAVTAFLAHVRAADPDVLTGWNVCEFDVGVLLRIAHRHGLRLTLGRTTDEAVIRRDQTFTREPRVILAGRQMLDGLSLLRSAFVRLDDYRLETAARAILGEGKLFGPDHRGAEIERTYREDPARLVAYNLHDARLVLDILARTGLVELTVRRSLLTGMQLDRVGAQIAAVDSLYLGALRARGRVAPSVRAGAGTEAVTIVGGLVLESVPGLYRNILVFDFRSLYPSLIRTFNIDPLTYLPPEAAAARPAAAVIRTPGGAAFRRDEPGILPELVARLADERARARQAGDAVGAQATKILMNSLFGVMGASASRLFSPAVANAITTAGQHVIRLAADAVAQQGHRVIYGDTDSLFVDIGEPDPARAAARGAALRDAIARDVAAAITREFGSQSHLELRFEKVYARFFMPEVRGGEAGSKKRYAGLVGDALELVGLEAVRRDWSQVARRFQRELLGFVFHDQPVADFIRAFVSDLRAGRYDAELAYRKAIRKPLEAYTKTTPPHVQAARKQAGVPGRIVAYLMTQAGPESVDEATAPPDYEHYISQQLRPIADQVLRFLGGPDFDALIGARRQLSLFE